MYRPTSAPGYHPATTTGPNRQIDGNLDTISEDSSSSVTSPKLSEAKLEFTLMESRANEALRDDNRGHKLPLEELPPARKSILPPLDKEIYPLTESEFQKVEQQFCERQHYTNNLSTSGLNYEQVRLLHSFWGQFSNRQESLRRLSHFPVKLSEAGNNLHIRQSLAALPATGIAAGLMSHVEETCQKLKVYLQTSDYLNTLLAQLEAGDLVPVLEVDSGIAQVPSISEGDKECILEALALCEHQIASTRKYLTEINSARSKIVTSVEYSHVIGRFLSKRYRKQQQNKSSTITALSPPLSEVSIKL